MGKTIDRNFSADPYQHVSYGVICMDRNKIVLTCNEEVAKALNKSKDQVIGKRYDQFLPKVPSIEKYIANGKVNVCSANISLNGIDYTFTTLCMNKHQHMICTLTEKQEKKEGDSFSLNNQSFRKVLDTSLDEIFITDGDGNILFVNAAAEALYGEVPKNLVNRNVLELEEEGFFSPSLFPIVKERGEKVSMIQRTKMGRTHHVIAYPSFNANEELINVVFNARDITEIRYLRDKIERSEALIHTYKSELEEINVFQDNKSGFIALAPNMLKIKQMINRIAQFDTTILITGESGVGKGVITKTIHEQSNRKDQPFIHINCGAIPESLIESELFGYEKGAFTGAQKDGRIGLIEQADKGILFLDEIAEMPLQLQVKLLKVLQERQFHRLGGSEIVRVDIRIIAATNQNLEELVEQGMFREDLYYRLNVVPINIPPLRTRPEDITYLIDYFFKQFNEKYGLSAYLSLEAENALHRYKWPGNVRELENLIERLVIMSESEEVQITDLPNHILSVEEEDNFAVSVNNIVTLKQAQEQMEEQLIRKAYEINSSSYKIANMLGINQSTAHRKINQYLKKRSLEEEH